LRVVSLIYYGQLSTCWFKFTSKFLYVIFWLNELIMYKLEDILCPLLLCLHSEEPTLHYWYYLYLITSQFQITDRTPLPRDLSFWSCQKESYHTPLWSKFIPPNNRMREHHHFAISNSKDHPDTNLD
jgi:hypothetical protein